MISSNILQLKDHVEKAIYVTCVTCVTFVSFYSYMIPTNEKLDHSYPRFTP